MSKALTTVVIFLVILLSFACNDPGVAFITVNDEMLTEESDLSFEDPDSLDFYFNQGTSRGVPSIYINNVDVPILTYNYQIVTTLCDEYGCYQIPYNYNGWTLYPDDRHLCIRIKTKTGTIARAGTDQTPFLYLQIYCRYTNGTYGWEQPFLVLNNPDVNNFQSGAWDTFYFIKTIDDGKTIDRIIGFSGHFGTAFTDGWYLKEASIKLNWNSCRNCSDGDYEDEYYSEDPINKWVDNDQNRTMPSYSEWVKLNNNTFYYF